MAGESNTQGSPNTSHSSQPANSQPRTGQQNARPQPTQGGQQGRGQPSQISQEDLNRIVLDFLNKKGFSRTEAMFRMESSRTPTAAGPPVNPSNTNISGPGEISTKDKDQKDKTNRSERELRELREKQIRLERELRESRDKEFRLAKEKELRELREFEEKQKRENDPETYIRAYSIVRNWVQSSLDLYKPELTRLLYPIFVHCFLELVAKNFPVQAKEFFDKYKDDHILLHSVDLNKLAGVSLPEHLTENELAHAYRTHKYRITISKITINLLLYFLHENEAVGGAALIRIINQYLNPIISTTRPDRIDQEGEKDPQEGISGFTTNVNEVDKFNEQQVKLGKLPMDPEVEKEIEADLKIRDEKTEGTNEKSLVEEFKDMTAPDEDSPARETLPLPLKDYSDIKRQILAVEDSRSKIKLDTVQASAPSVCMYTLHNTNSSMACLEFNDDSNLMAGGFQDSHIKLWSLDGKPLRSVFKRDKQNNSNSRKLIGHSGPVFGLSFSPDNRFLVSSSEDKTARLWSLDSYSALVSYKGHNAPVWDVKFSPFGHYFATASHDQTARLWATDHIYPLRIFAGHINDVDCVEFHPNSNYIFTGSSDKTSRLWDVQSGNSVRVFMGHTGQINCMAVSPDGRWLATAGEDSVVNVWDVGSGRKLKTMRGHGRTSIYSLSFSREGAVLLSGGADNTVRVWDIKKNTSDAGPEPETFSFESGDPNKPTGNELQNKTEKHSRREIIATSDHMTAYFTKKTPVMKVHFTRRNLGLAGGCFMG